MRIARNKRPPKAKRQYLPGLVRMRRRNAGNLLTISLMTSAFKTVSDLFLIAAQPTKPPKFAVGGMAHVNDNIQEEIIVYTKQDKARAVADTVIYGAENLSAIVKRAGKFMK